MQKTTLIPINRIYQETVQEVLVETKKYKRLKMGLML